MSQRMDYDEPDGQQQVPPFDSYQSGYNSFASSFGQKIPAGSGGSRSATAGQRLALAIVSLCLLPAFAGIIFGISVPLAGFFGLVGGLIGFGLVCITIIAVNFVFNRGS